MSNNDEQRRAAQEAARKAAEATEELIQKAAQNANDRYQFGWRGVGAPKNPTEGNHTSSNLTNTVKEHLQRNHETSEQQSETKEYMEGTGTYNKADHDISKIGESALEGVKASVSDADAVRGYRQTQKYASLVGSGSITRATLSTELSNQLYNRPKLAPQDAQRLQQMFGNDRNPYKIHDSATGNVLKDYRSNTRAVYDFLERNGINAKNMSAMDINIALKSGKIGSIQNISPDMRFALEELMFLKKQEGKVNQLRAAKGGIRNTARTWVNTAMEGSDVKAGYETAKTAVAVMKAAKLLGKGATGATLNTGIEVISLSERAIVKAQKGAAKAKASNTKDLEVKKKWEAKERYLQEKNDKIKVKAGETHSKINTWTSNTTGQNIKWGIQTATKKITETETGQKITKTISSTKPVKGAKAAKDKYAQFKKRTNIIKNRIAKASKPFTIIPNAISALNAVIKKILVGVFVALFIFVIVFTIFFAILSAIDPNCAVPGDKAGSRADPKTKNAQIAIDTVYEKQQSYEQNISDYAAGSERARFGLLNNWVLTEPGETPETSRVNNEPLVVHTESAESYNMLGYSGYDLSHYWGPKKCEYTTSVGKFVGFESVEHDNGTITNEAKYEPVEMTLIGTGGLFGDASDGNIYTSLYVIIPESAECYYNRDANGRVNPNVKKYIRYTGTPYSEYEKKDQYIEDNYAKYKLGRVTADGGIRCVGVASPAGDEVQYSANNMYKGFVSAAMGITENDDENSAFFTKYCEQLYVNVANNAEILPLIVQFEYDWEHEITFQYQDPNDPTGLIQDCTAVSKMPMVQLYIYYRDTGIQDILRLDTADNDWLHTNGSTGVYKITSTADRNYREWKGWWLPDGTMSEEHYLMLDYYELNEEDWRYGFEGIVFPSDRVQELNDAEILAMIDQILTYEMAEGLTADQEQLINFALSCVGKFYYEYSAGHGNLDNVGGGLDCSGFASYVLYHAGLIGNTEAMSCSALLNRYPSTRFNGDFSSLKPGSMIIKNKTAGGATTSSNHVVIYLGKMQLEGDSSPRDYCVECTTTKNGSGVQLSSPSRMETIKNYQYVINPLG